MKRNNIPLEITEKNKAKISMAFSIAVLFLLCLIITQVDKAFVSAKDKASEAEEQAAEAGKEAAPETSVSTIRILAAGNNIYDENILASGQTGGDSWNYDAVYSLVKDQISQVDLSIVTQESPFTADHNLTSASDVYSTPVEVGSALANTGFDIIASATEHADDFGSEYLQSTLEFWQSSYPDVAVVGIHGSQEDAATVRVVEKNNIRIAFLNYAFGSKSNSIQNNAPFMVDYMQRERVTNAIAQAKNISDCIIFLAHWGNLDNAVPTEYQNQWAQFLLQQGVKVLIGSHPLTLQPCQMLSDGSGNEMLVYYSLGSLVSGAQSAPELLGGLAEFTLEKTTVGEQTSVKVTSNNLIPTVMHYSENMNICNVYPLSAYTDDLAKSHGILAVDHYSQTAMTVAGFQNLFDYIMKIPVEASGNSNLLDYTFNPDSTLSGVDGSIIYPGEIAAANEADGSLDSLLQVMSGENSMENLTDDAGMYDSGMEY